jgi:hypothetical protein
MTVSELCKELADAIRKGDVSPEVPVRIFDDVRSYEVAEIYIASYRDGTKTVTLRFEQEKRTCG